MVSIGRYMASIVHGLDYISEHTRIMTRPTKPNALRLPSHTPATWLSSLPVALLAMLLVLCAGPTLADSPDEVFGQVAERARKLAAQPYLSPAPALPEPLRTLSYDQMRDIRFKPAEALWRKEGLPFEAMFFHLGKYVLEPVTIHELVDGQMREIPFSTRLFDYGQNRFDTRRWGDIGFAGLRLHYPLNSPQYKDELIVFQGASYFRALGAGQIYGISARGLAIDTVGGKGEEFPRFTEFWLVRPSAGARETTILALLDSPSASGAYRFVVQPGATTTVDVSARLYLRKPVATLGLAPLTSMFLAGENQPPRGGFRPEIHDSDGLAIHTAQNEWIWRPLINPPHILTTSFALENPRGFGLMQRDRQFASYEDTEARYDKRPSAWIEPQGDWGRGRVELVLLPTPDETHDNVVAYWVPERTPTPGAPLDLRYRLHMQGTQQALPPHGHAVQARRGAGFAPLAADEEHFVIDFAGPALDRLRPDAAVRARIETSANARIEEHTVFRNEGGGGWRLALRLKRQDKQPIELRAYLQHQQDTLTETWNAILPPLPQP